MTSATAAPGDAASLASASGAARGAAPDQEKVTLELKEGNNQFLMKIVNHAGGSGFYFKAKGNELPPAIAAAIRVPANERNESQKQAIEQYYLSISPAMAETRSKTAALQKMLVGESKCMFDNWRLQGMPFDKILAKLKDYARSRRLDGEASKGKQAVGLSRVQNWADEELVEGEEGVEVNEDGSITRVNIKR